ncbi:MAG: hypothetical protein IPK50_18960 [Fibrobacterota bacterium]|nr:MAG: hypothetical protein IPK50_18960 [Fibrobacterota bacterium]
MSNDQKKHQKQSLENSRNKMIDIENLRYGTVNEDLAKQLVMEYEATKNLPIRYRILRLLCLHDYPVLETFFKSAISRERYLDMKILAIKGYAQFASEKSLTKVMENFCDILAKRELSTPYNYGEYEFLRGKHALPFLAEKYGYASFLKALQQTNEQYERMPDAFKGIFTTNEFGEQVRLLTPEESSARINAFRAAARAALPTASKATLA